MNIADLLRLFADGDVDGLLLDEGPAPVGELVDPEAHCPVLNIAGHYEWPVLICSGTVPAWPHGPVTGVAGWIGSSTPSQPPTAAASSRARISGQAPSQPAVRTCCSQSPQRAPICSSGAVCPRRDLTAQAGPAGSPITSSLTAVPSK
jgi:hypothetical protein